LDILQSAKWRELFHSRPIELPNDYNNDAYRDENERGAIVHRVYPPQKHRKNDEKRPYDKGEFHHQLQWLSDKTSGPASVIGVADKYSTDIHE
jgi:hypothetical protein